MNFTLLPTLNAILNAISGMLILAGYRQIRAGNHAVHKKFMLGAISVSTLFFLSYVIYHYNVGSVKFEGVGFIRYIYFSILISHTILAVAIVPLVGSALFFALKSRFDEHRKVVKWAFPSWVYVSVTGVLIYIMLYRM